MTEPTYYVVKNGNHFDLRQIRFRGRKTEHPHDVVAAGFTAEGLRYAIDAYFGGAANVENMAALEPQA